MCGDSDVFNVRTDEAFFDRISLCRREPSVGAIIRIVALAVVIVGVVFALIFTLMDRQRQSRDSPFELLDTTKLARSADYF
jgi:hypothetical protein